MTEETAKKIMQLTNNSYEKIAHEFSASRNVVWDDFELMVPYIKKGMHILDAGCGNGRLFSLLQNKEVRYTGIDASASLISEAKKKYETYSEQPFFLIGDVLTSNFEQGFRERFDVVCMAAVLNHIPTHALQKKAIEHIRSILAPKGILFITNWNLWQWTLKRKSVWKYALERLRLSDAEWEKKYRITKKELGWRDLLTLWRGGAHNEILYYYTFYISELTSLLRVEGFTILEAYYSMKGKKSHWWNGQNSVIVAQNNAKH